MLVRCVLGLVPVIRCGVDNGRLGEGAILGEGDLLGEVVRLGIALAPVAGCSG